MWVQPSLGAAGLVGGGGVECREILEPGPDQVWEVSPQEGTGELRSGG